MADLFERALAAYRTQSAESFYRSQQAKTYAPKRELAQTPSGVSCQTFERITFPALNDYLARAAQAYEEWKLHKPDAKKKRTKPQRLGSGEPVEALFAHLRRERWLTYLAKRAHAVRALVAPHIPVIHIVLCGIPKDIRQSAHQRYKTRKSALLQSLNEERDSSASPALGFLKGDEDLTICSALVTKDESYLVHISRCQALYSEGKRIITRMNKTMVGTFTDDFEEVRRRYLGKPDELYRRKTARKFAKWRRRQRVMEKEKLAVETRAEKEMKRRRGFDHRLTMREARDPTFAPFLFDTDCTAYAYSSKITEAPKLRKIMMTKYSDTNESSEGQGDQWERARQAAETNPLFHTRVMNRFS